MEHEAIKSGGFAIRNVPNVVDTTWAWINQQQGLIKWTFSNKSSKQQSFVLLRSGYYFGNAFWCVYEANPQFDTSFMDKVEPLVDQGFALNSPPLAVVDFGNGKKIVCFVFTLAAGQTWAMEEGGFVGGVVPSGITTYGLVEKDAANFIIGYSQAQVTQWDAQTGTNYQGYSPNPNTFNVVEFSVDSTAPYVELFPGDSVVSASSSSSGNSGSGTPPPAPAPNPEPAPATKCIEEIMKGIETANLNDFVQGIECLISNDTAISEDMRTKFEAEAMKMIAALEKDDQDTKDLVQKLDELFGKLKTKIEDAL